MRRLRARIWLLLWFALSGPVGASVDTVQYIYDELGRLIAVVDPSGQSAIYHYDAVGNVVSIERRLASQVSIFTFSPIGGVAGTTVTIFGSGFSAIAADDGVTFNGVTATVSSATTTTLVVTVPAGATTGAIAVTAPGGAATSARVFTVGSGAPTITGLSPSIATAGTTLTVSGTNFNQALASNRVSINLTGADVTSATSTTLTTAVPARTLGGRVSVSTPLGTAVSSSDLFVPPSPNLPADVVTTDRMTIGSSKVVTIGTAGKLGLVLFDGMPGRRVSVGISSVSLSIATVTVYDAFGTSIGTTGVGTSGGLIEPMSESSGTYTILVKAGSTSTGSMTLTLYDVPADVTAAIVPGGSPVTVTTTTPGQNAKLTFSGTVSNRISLNLTNDTIASGNVSIFNPDGSTLRAPTFLSTSGVFIDTLTLPATGTYTILVDPSFANTGTVKLTLYDVPADVSGSIVPGGSAVSVTMTVPGQNGRLTFSGTATQRVSLNVTNVTVSAGNVSVLNPDGSTLRAPTFTSTAGVFIDTLTLGTTGTYTIVLDPSQANTGSMTLTLYDVPPDASGTTSVGGSASTLTITTPGQNGGVTFSGTAGQLVTVHVTGNTIGFTTVSLQKPDGTQLTSTSNSAASFNLSQQTLPVTGTYRIVVDPSLAKTGGITLSVTNP